MILEERMVTFLETLVGDIPEYLRNIEREALTQNVPIIKKQTQSLLCFFLELMKPYTILEVGTAVGFSSILMSEYTSPDCHITTIEKSPKRIEAAKINIKAYHKEQRITLLEGDASEHLTKLADGHKIYDFIFMDAAKGQYLNFLPEIKKLLSPRGMLITDNVLQEGDILESRYAVTRRDRTIHTRMREYLLALTKEAEWKTIVLPIGDGVAVSIYKKYNEGERKPDEKTRTYGAGK